MVVTSAMTMKWRCWVCKRSLIIFTKSYLFLHQKKLWLLAALTYRPWLVSRPSRKHIKPGFAGREKPKLLEARGGGPGLWFSRPEPPKAGPNTRLSGQAGPVNHYLVISCHKERKTKTYWFTVYNKKAIARPPVLHMSVQLELGDSFHKPVLLQGAHCLSPSSVAHRNGEWPKE